MTRLSSRQSLRTAGLKATRAREVLLGTLESADRPLTVDEIASGLAEPRPGRPTIYRNLEHFVREGWAECFVDRNQVQRFFRCGAAEHHHHIHCERCQRTTAMAGCALEATLARFERQHGYKITHHQLLVYGVCPDCRKADGEVSQ
jgi:Fur family transcriptional regulator, ferric uptake regulator